MPSVFRAFVSDSDLMVDAIPAPRDPMEMTPSITSIIQTFRLTNRPPELVAAAWVTAVLWSNELCRAGNPATLSPEAVPAVRGKICIALCSELENGEEALDLTSDPASDDMRDFGAPLAVADALKTRSGLPVKSQTRCLLYGVGRKSPTGHFATFVQRDDNGVLTLYSQRGNEDPQPHALPDVKPAFDTVNANLRRRAGAAALTA